MSDQVKIEAVDVFVIGVICAIITLIISVTVYKLNICKKVEYDGSRIIYSESYKCECDKYESNNNQKK